MTTGCGWVAGLVGVFDFVVVDFVTLKGMEADANMSFRSDMPVVGCGSGIWVLAASETRA